MNFEQLTSATEKSKQQPELPPELIKLAVKGIRDAKQAQEFFTEVAKSMVLRGVGDEQEAYLKILHAIAELKQHELELKKHLN